MTTRRTSYKFTPKDSTTNIALQKECAVKDCTAGKCGKVLVIPVLHVWMLMSAIAQTVIITLVTVCHLVSDTNISNDFGIRFR